MIGENLQEKDTRVNGTVATEGLPYQDGGKKWVVANYLRKVGYLLPPTSYLLLSSSKHSLSLSRRISGFLPVPV